MPSVKDWARAKWAIARGALIGFFLGIIPGAGPVISPFVSYATEKRVSKHPEKFGHGMIQGVAGPESANNAAAQASFIPLFTLGIPSNVTMAIFFGALLIFGLQPGPLLIREHPELFWGVVSSMYIGNAILVILNLPLIPLWVRVLKVPYRILFPLILLFCIIGSYSIKYSTVDIFVMIAFGIIGYLMKKFKYEPAPLVMAFVLGPLLEENLRRSLILSEGSFVIFVTHPISAFTLLLTLFLVPLFFLRRKKQGAKE
jgi:putative tricarboxylic transport membrane protein